MCNISPCVHLVRNHFDIPFSLVVMHTISLGNAAIFLIGGVTRDVEPTPILLRSGDVVIMSGPECRRAYHGATLPTARSLQPDLVVLPKVCLEFLRAPCQCIFKQVMMTLTGNFMERTCNQRESTLMCDKCFPKDSNLV